MKDMNRPQSETRGRDRGGDNEMVMNKDQLRIQRQTTWSRNRGTKTTCPICQEVLSASSSKMAEEIRQHAIEKHGMCGCMNCIRERSRKTYTMLSDGPHVPEDEDFTIFRGERTRGCE